MSITLNKLTRQFFDALLEDIDNNYYYLIYSHPAPWPMDFSPPEIVHSTQDVEFDTEFYTICGKRVTMSDVKFMARRFEWTIGTAYDQYDHTANLTDKRFFVITDENHVYKCLFNNKKAPSRVKPSLVQNTVFQTSDGYYWKYMYSLTSGELNRFGLSDYIPVQANNDIVQSATTGIDLVEIVNPGVGYVTYNKGTVLSVSNTSVLQIDTTAIRDNGFYNLSSIYINEGPGIGGYARITQYISNDQGNWVYLDNPILGLVPTLSRYVISPSVIIEGDGSNARAISHVNPSIGIVEKIDVVVPGTGYTVARAYLEANTSYGRDSSIAVYPGPPGGHGFEPVSELQSNRIMISKTISGSEGNTIPSYFDFRRVGLIKNPYMANTNDPWQADTFNNTYEFEVQNSLAFTKNMTIRGLTSKARGYIFNVKENGNLEVVGDKSFVIGETIEYISDPRVRSNITDIPHYPDLERLGDILDINNNVPISKENTSEIAKITIEIQ